jgi:2-keto-3-deoxy-L-rhamnonate aldolase RhmA
MIRDKSIQRCAGLVVYFVLGVSPPTQSTPMFNPVQATIPAALPDVLAQVHGRTDEIKQLMDRGEFGSIYVPALQAKELALALETHRSELPSDGEKLLDSALNRVVRYAYLLDVVGDLGNKDEVVAAYAQFVAAERDVEAAFVPAPGEPR